VSFSSASARPLDEEKYWREVPEVKALDAGGRVFLASNLDASVLQPLEATGHSWAKFRLASRKWSHFSFASLAAPVSPLKAPAKPQLTVEWVDSPSLDGVRIRVAASCDVLTQAYQLRFRLRKDASWQLCDVVPLKLPELRREEGGVEMVEALAPIHRLAYHSEYHFSIRTCSLSRFSPWSEESNPFCISLEQHGMCQDASGVQIEIYGQEERHNCRCTVAEVSWTPLALPNEKADVTIEYRLRWRRRLEAYNDAVALFAAMDGLRSLHGEEDGVESVRLMVPDPDDQVQDIAKRGYEGDGAKRFCGAPDFSPWQSAAVLRAKVGPETIERCSYSLTFLQPDTDYEIQIDWRWQRLGDVFWMPAYPSKRFRTPAAPQPLPWLQPLRILPQVWDEHEQLRSLCNLCQAQGQRLGRGFGLFQWPFVRSPSSDLAAKGQLLTEEWRKNPGLVANFMVQCRRKSWSMCQVALLDIAGKTACFAFAPPEQPVEEQILADATDEPKPSNLPEIPVLDDDEMEFRLLRGNDCEVSEVLRYPALPLEPPVDVKCRLKMTEPHSTFGVSISFHGLPSQGFNSAPEEYQLLLQEVEGESIVKEQILPPQRLPLSRIAEAFPEALERPDFLCSNARAREPAARGGGQRQRRLEELEFEHFVTEVNYGKAYRLAVRWISRYKVSPWSDKAEIQVTFSPPSTAQEALLVGLLPDERMSTELAGKDPCFASPSLWHRFELTWQPFVASLWGSRMEYRLERRSLLHDRREDPEGILPDAQSEELNASQWEHVGQVVAAIEDATGKGCYQLTNCSRPAPTAKASEEMAKSVEQKQLVRCVLDMVYQSHADSAYAETSYGRRRLTEAVRRMTYASAGAAEEVEGLDDLEGAPLVASPDAPEELHFHAEELQPSVTYQFRLFARLCFHPSSGHHSEWSAPLLSAWHRTAEAVPPPSAPIEAVAPDPPPLEMLEDATVLLEFPDLPGREEGPDTPARPGPYQLQFRGALEPSHGDWHVVEPRPLDDDPTKILVMDPRLSKFAEDGVIFRLWRPQLRFGDAHRVKDDARVRHYTSLSSVPSKALRSKCAAFDEYPKVTLVFHSSADLREDSENPPPTAMLRLDWKVHVPSNATLMPVRLHQVRFRRVKPIAKDASWQELPVFERYIFMDSSHVRHQIPLVGPNFLMGADYEVSVRMATDLRWGDWSPAAAVSLAMHPPQPPVKGLLQLDDLSLPDGATFFRLTWPAFDTHPLCNLIEYRIRMQRVSHFRYMERLSEEIKSRAKESFEAQEETYVVGTIRVRVPQHSGPAKGFGVPYEEGERENLQFEHRVAADAEFGYRFFVDAKHERYREVDGQQDTFLKFAGEQEDWSIALESRESIVPAMPRNWFVPEQVPVDADPDPEKLRITFPLKLNPADVDSVALAVPENLQVLLFAPWKVAAEASRWPHRVEYSPYLPDINGGRLPMPGDASEDHIDWYLPETVEYLREAENHLPSGGKGPEQCAFVLAKGFDEKLWETEMARQALHLEQTKALGLFARIRVVREGGPEGMQLLSSPSRPLRLSMPTVEDLSVSVWSSNGRFCALLWWPSVVAACAEKDKNLDMSGQLHQVRLRRPDYEHDAGWIESQVKRTLPPVTVRRSCGTHAPHTFDVCHLLDDSILPEELHSEVLPLQAYGAFRNEECMTFEFSVRVSDGFRWSAWSPPSTCCFAVEPTIVSTAQVELDELQRAISAVPDVVSPATAVESTKPLMEQLTFTADGDMEPPYWVAIAKPPDSPDVLRGTARLSQFLVSWPNLPPSAYCHPDPEILPAVKQMSETGSLPPFLAPPLLYRINVWMVGLSPDAADAASEAAALHQTLTLEEAEAETRDLLYRQYDVPPSAYPDAVDYDEPTVTRLYWHLPTLPPDKTYRCTVEARFETNTSVHWWTPLMRSHPFVVERVPAPAPPQPLPVAELPTPEQQKLLARMAPHSNAWLAVRWPWRVQGRHLDIIKESSHILEFCPSDGRQSLRDPSAEPVNIEGETAMKGRALGQWKEAKALQVCFAHFAKNEVTYELPAEATNEPNWVPVLVASGLWPAEGEAEPDSVHLRWRYRAGLSELASTNSCLHFSAATGPVRTMIGIPMAPEIHMAVPERASRLAGWLHWNAWQGAEKHQFSYRILGKQKKGQRHVRGLLSDSESSDTLDGTAMSSTPKEQKLQAITGWIELPPVVDDIKRKLEVEHTEHEESTDLLVTGEAGRIASFERKLSGTEWQRVLWRHYHQKQEEFWDPASRDGDHESSWQFSSLSPAHATLEDTDRTSLGGTKTRDVPFRIRPSHALEWRVRVGDGLRWSKWSETSEPAQLAPPIPRLAGPVRLIFNRREPTVVKVVWSACEPLENCEHLMDSIEYLVFMAIDETTGRELIQDEGNFDVNRLHNWGVHLSDGACGRLLPYVGEEEDAVAEFDFEGLFSESSEKRLLGKFRHKEMRTISAEGDGGPPTVQGFELFVSGLKPHCMHRISVCVRCVVENVPEPDWQRLKLDPSHPLRWSDPFHSSPLLTPLRPPPMLVPELVPIPDGRFGRFLHTPCILLKCAMFAKQNKNDSDKDHSVVVDCRPAGSTDEDYQLAGSSIYCEPVEYGPCRLVYNLPYLHAEIRTRNITMNDVSAASIPFFAVPPLTIEDSKGPTIRLVVGKEGTLSVRVEWTSRCLPGQKPKLLQIGVRRHAVDQICVQRASESVLPQMCLEELPTAALCMAEDFEGLMTDAAARYQSQGGILRDESPYYCRHCFQPFQRKVSEDDLPVLGPNGKEWISQVKDVLKLSAVAIDEIGPSNPIDTAALRAPHWVQLEHERREEANPWEAIRKAKNPCCCRDVFCCKEMHVDGEELVHGTVYTFRLRVSDGQRWTCWSEYSPPIQVVIPPPKPPVPYQETLVPTPPPTVEVVFVKDDDDTIQSAVEGLKGPDIRLRLRWPRFEGRMQEVEYRILMWTLSPEQRKRATGLEKGPLPPIVGIQSIFTSSSFPGVTAQVDESSAPRIVRPVVPDCSPVARARPRTIQPGVQDAPEILAHVQPFDPPERGARSNELPPTLEAEVNVMPVPKGHGYVFAVEAKHCRGALGNLGEWSPPMFSRFIEFQHQNRELSLEVDARFGTLLFKGQAATQPKPKNEKLQMEANAVSFVDEHRDLPRAMPLLTNPGGDPWPIGASPKKFIMRSKGRTVYAERLDDEKLPELPEARPRKDDFREG